MTAALPCARLLTPPFSDAAPAGFAVVAGEIANGLPHRLELSAELSVKLTVPTGLARQWLDLAPGTVVSSSADQTAPFDPNAAERVQDRQAPRLSVTSGGRTIGRAPLALGRPLRFARDGSPVEIELAVLGWSLSAAAVRGPASDGSFLRLAWRAAGRAIDAFGPPPVSSYVVRRIEPAQRAESQLYRHDLLQYRGHLANSVVRKVQPWR